jgi:hypothetical protein
MNTPTNLQDLIKGIIDLANPLLAVLVALALLTFFWGLTKFISKAGDAKNHAEGRQLMVWGLIALFVMVSIYGIIQFFHVDLFGADYGLPQLPEVERIN